MSTKRFLFQKILQLFLTLFLVTAIAFILMKLSPIDAAEAYARRVFTKDYKIRLFISIIYDFVCILYVYLTFKNNLQQTKSTVQRPIKSPFHQGKQILLSTVRP